VAPLWNLRGSLAHLPNTSSASLAVRPSTLWLMDRGGTRCPEALAVRGAADGVAHIVVHGVRAVVRAASSGAGSPLRNHFVEPLPNRSSSVWPPGLESAVLGIGVVGGAVGRMTGVAASAGVAAGAGAWALGSAVDSTGASAAAAGSAGRRV
jgi:hypothetical protein